MPRPPMTLPAQHFVLHLLIVIPLSIHPRVIYLCSCLPNARLFLFHLQQFHLVELCGFRHHRAAGAGRRGPPPSPSLADRWAHPLACPSGTGHLQEKAPLIGVCAYCKYPGQAGILQGGEVAPSSTSNSWLWVTGTS